jgi:galactosylceramidase
MKSASLLVAALAVTFFSTALWPSAARADQTVVIDGTAGGKQFDGIGAVSGGGATSVLLKDYPQKQRDQVLDLLFKPKFGASISALYVEVGGDGNSTQGTEDSHMHSRTDENYSRGYEWWLMTEAKKRNPAMSLDACAWSCPGWVGVDARSPNGNFWSQDMCDYYAKWIKGLKTNYGLDLDAIGCRNEKGVNEAWVKMFRTTLDNDGLNKVRIHGFDNWDKTKFDFTNHFLTDPALAKAVDVVSNHTMATSPTPDAVRKLLDGLNKPIWNSEEHVYKQGFDCEISIVQAFNQNYINSGVTKICNWYLVASLYPIEPYPETPSMLIARSPWSGNYAIRPAMWGYAHYGQFSAIGWQYLNGACGNLSGGGTFVTLKSPGTDYSFIAETKNATAKQTVTINVKGGLSAGKLCVWRSNAQEQFVKLDDINPVNGSFSITLDPASIYSISTTTGQQKGSFDDVPAERDFPLPYYENFDHYKNAKSFGYLPHYTADISGVFELADRPDGKGQCLRQVLDKKAQSWAPESMPYTVIGDSKWKDYEVSADTLMDDGGWVGVMGRVSNTGSGYGTDPKGYYLRLGADGEVSLVVAGQAQGRGGAAAGRGNAPIPSLATATISDFDVKQWHNLKLQFTGQHIVGFIDNKQVLAADNSAFGSGLAGLMTGGTGNARNTAMFDNLLINTVNGPVPSPTDFVSDSDPMYK